VSQLLVSLARAIRFGLSRIQSVANDEPRLSGCAANRGNETGFGSSFEEYAQRTGTPGCMI